MARSRLTALTLVALVVCPAWAQSEPADPNGAPSATQPFFSRIRGLFDIDLPDLDPAGTVKLVLHPHIGDLVRRDYMRVETGFRWAVNRRLELSSEASVFFRHGLSGGNDGYGIGEVRLGGKYLFEQWPWPDYESSAVLNVEIPTGRPPVDMTDGHNHFMPSLVIQHHWRDRPRLTTFGSVGMDILTPNSASGTFYTNQPHDDSIAVTLGGVYDRGQIKWTLSGTYATTALLGDEKADFYYLRPSLLWYVPKKLTLNSKTQWIIGFGTPMSWGPDGYELNARLRVRAEITFRQVMDNMRNSSR